MNRTLAFVAILGALALAGGVAWAVLRRTPTPGERILGAAISPIEAAATAVSIAPWVIGLVVVISVLAVGFTLVKFGPEAVKGAITP